MADEYKEIAETGDNGGSKKKKIIIGVAVAVVICAAVAVVCALTLGGNDKEEYTDAPVSTEPASELTPGIENGVFVDGAPTTQPGSSSGSSDQQSGSSGSGSSGGSSSSSSGGSSSSGSSSSGGSSSSRPSGGGSSSGVGSGGATVSGSAQALINEASKHLGKPYVWGAKGPNSFDCSGFVYYCLNQVGVSQSYLTSSGWRNPGRYQRISNFDSIQAGDIVVVSGHVGIAAGGGTVIDASSSNGRVVHRSLSSWWRNNFIVAWRIFG